MKFKLSTLAKAVSTLKIEIGGWNDKHEDAEVEIALHEEQIGDGEFFSHMKMTCIVVEETSGGKEKVINKSLQIFASDESRKATLTTTEVKELD